MSGSRKIEELNRIFASVNKEKSRKLLIDLGIDKYLGIKNMDSIIMCDDIIGIWSQLELVDEYPMSKSEKELINNIREMLKMDIDKYSVYKYGLYVSTVVGSIKGISYKKINNIYKNLEIYSKKDININANDIIKILNREPGNYLKEILSDIEVKIINGEVNNEYDSLSNYVKSKY